MRRTTLAELRAHPRRLLATALAVILAVGFVTGTLIVADTAQASFYDVFARSARNVDASVLPPADAHGDRPGRLTAAQLAAVRALPEVAVAQARMVAPLAMLDADGTRLTNFGQVGWAVAADGDARLHGLDSTGPAPTAPDEAWLDIDTASHQRLRVGDAITVLDAAGRPHRYRLTGLLDLGTSQRFAGSSVVGLPGSGVTALTGETGYTEIVAIARAGVSQAQLADAVRGALGPGLDIATGDQRRASLAEQASKVADEFVLALSLFALVALIVAGFVIYNTFAILLAQRIRQTALLRCVGASRRQVFGSVLGEATIIGLLGGVLGVGFGFAVAMAMAGLLNAFLQASIPVTDLSVTALPILAGLSVGVLMTVISALLPAIRSTRTSPLAALRELPSAPVTKRRGRVIRLLTGLAVATLGVAITVAGAGQSAPGPGTMLTVAGGVLTFLAVLVWSPLFIGPLTAAVGAVPGRFLGTPARLAVANARRNPGRTAVTTATLMMCIGLLALCGVVLASVQATAANRLAEQFPVDYLLSAVRYGDPAAQPLPAGYAGALRERSEFSTVVQVRVADVTLDGAPARIAAVDPDAIGALVKPKISAGAVGDRHAGMVIAPAARPGDTVTAAAGGTTRRLTVTGTGQVQLPGIMPVDALLSWAQFADLVGPGQPTTVLAKAAPGVSATASRDALESLAKVYPLVQISSVAELSDQLSTAVQGLIIVFAGLLGTAVIIALFGVTNTLSLSVVERTRESAVVRALGLTRGQLRATLLAEALLMGAIGALVGIGYGLVYGWLVIEALLSNVGAEIVVPWAILGGLIVLALAAAALAAALPARRAARASIVEAIGAS